jgi:hypothetical protein
VEYPDVIEAGVIGKPDLRLRKHQKEVMQLKEFQMLQNLQKQQLNLINLQNGVFKKL